MSLLSGVMAINNTRWKKTGRQRVFGFRIKSFFYCDWFMSEYEKKEIQKLK